MAVCACAVQQYVLSSKLGKREKKGGQVFIGPLTRLCTTELTKEGGRERERDGRGGGGNAASCSTESTCSG